MDGAATFAQFAIDRQYNVAPAVLPAPDRIYADRHTQEAFEIWNAGAASVARILTELTCVRNLREFLRAFPLHFLVREKHSLPTPQLKVAAEAEATKVKTSPRAGHHSTACRLAV